MVNLVKWLAFVSVISAAGNSLFAADTDPLQKRMNDVKGTWQIVAQFRDGRPVPEEEYQGAQLIVEDGKFSARRGNDLLHAGTFSLVAVEGDLSRAEVDFQQGPRAGQKYRQVSHLQAKTLVICTVPFENPWPKDFASTSENRCFLAVYKRGP